MSLGENIKVHFAGSDGEPKFDASIKCAGVNYRLYSCYEFIAKKKIDDTFLLKETSSIKTYDKEYKHVIQDSGLFTLMFGAGKGQKIDLDFLIDWQDKLIKFVKENDLKCTCVEIDCQKILGVEEAWFLRKRMKKLLPNRQINVFHYEDGKEGLDRLIDFSDYIAISVPELRIVKPKRYKEYVCSLTRYIKRKKPSIDIHLLGCTEIGLLKENTFCTSADSTSWLSGVRYGSVNDGVKMGHVRNFKKELFEQREEEIKKLLNQRGISYGKSLPKHYTNASLCASACLRQYIKACGNQD